MNLEATHSEDREPGSGSSSSWPDLADLFDELGPGLTGAVRGILGRHADVDEVLQDVFLKAWRSRDRIPPPDDARAWIFVIALNTARDARRRRERKPPPVNLEKVEDMSLRADDHGPESELMARESLERVRDAVHDLDDSVREVFLLKTSGTLTYEAIAESLGIPVGTAKTRMRYALANLRRALIEPSGPRGGVIHES